MVTLRNIRRISCNKVVCKAWLNSLVGSEQVSSCWADFSISAKQMQNLVCAKWKCLGVEQWKCNKCQEPVKISRCWVNPQKGTE